MSLLTYVVGLINQREKLKEENSGSGSTESASTNTKYVIANAKCEQIIDSLVSLHNSISDESICCEMIREYLADTYYIHALKTSALITA